MRGGGKDGSLHVVPEETPPIVEAALREIDFSFLSNWMGYHRIGNFPFEYEFYRNNFNPWLKRNLLARSNSFEFGKICFIECEWKLKPHTQKNVFLSNRTDYDCIENYPFVFEPSGLPVSWKTQEGFLSES